MKILSKSFLGLSCLAVALISTGCDQTQMLEASNRNLSTRLGQANDKINRLKTELDRVASSNESLLAQKSSDQRKIDALEKSNKDKTARILQFQDAIKKLDSEKGSGEKIVVVSGALPKQLSKALQKFANANPGIATFDAKNGMVKLKSDLTFPPGSANVNNNAKQALKKLVEILNTDEAKDFSVYIAGHTDDMRISRPATRRNHPTNWHLSVHRAIGVEKVLTADGLSPKRICVMGFGEHHPIVPNKPNKKGAAANRRVEIWIVPTGAFVAPASDTADSNQ